MPLAERAFGCLSMLFELLFDGGIDRRFLGEQVLRIVTLLTSWGEREAAIFVVAVSPME